MNKYLNKILIEWDNNSTEDKGIILSRKDISDHFKFCIITDEDIYNKKELRMNVIIGNFIKSFGDSIYLSPEDKWYTPFSTETTGFLQKETNLEYKIDNMQGGIPLPEILYKSVDMLNNGKIDIKDKIDVYTYTQALMLNSTLSPDTQLIDNLGEKMIDKLDELFLLNNYKPISPDDLLCYGNEQWRIGRRGRIKEEDLDNLIKFGGYHNYIYVDFNDLKEDLNMSHGGLKGPVGIFFKYYVDNNSLIQVKIFFDIASKRIKTSYPFLEMRLYYLPIWL
jgi:hypothetical protein